MLYDASVQDPVFAHGRPPEKIQEILTSAQERLGIDSAHPWRLISARRRMGKILFEIEEASGGAPVRLIGKVCRTDRAEHLHATLELLRENGFRAPSRFLVPAPIACIPDLGFILQERATGVQVSDELLKGGSKAIRAATGAAQWLARLHQSGLPAPPFHDKRQLTAQWSRELAHKLPERSEQISKIASAVSDELAKPQGRSVPCHGDFHAMNVFIADDDRVTAIDLDKFGQGPREADVGYFLMQSAAFDFFSNASFVETTPSRREFIHAYEAAAGEKINLSRTAAYAASAFLKNLHFELVLLDTGSSQYTGPWLQGAEAAVLRSDLDRFQ